MPISSKKIIEHIKSLPGTFDKKDLICFFITQKKEKKLSKPITKKKKKKKEATNKNLKKIEDTLTALVKSEFLARKKNKIIKIQPFKVNGYITINTSNNDIVATSLGDQIVVLQKNIGYAKNNDYVTVEIIDYKQGYLQGLVKQIIEHDRDIFSAKIIKKTKSVIFLKLLDIAGNVEVCADRSEHEPANDDIVMIKILNEILANKQKCQILKFFSLKEEIYDLERIKAKYNLPNAHIEYPELKQIKKNISLDEFKNRKDYREPHSGSFCVPPPCRRRCFRRQGERSRPL